MEIMHIILMHDETIQCKRKNCKNKALVTPVDIDGNWTCPRCEKKQKIVSVNSVKITMTDHSYEW